MQTSPGSGASLGGGIFISGDQTCGGTSCGPADATKAALTLTDSGADPNTASTQGGGIYTSRTTFSLTNSLVSWNAADVGQGLGGGMKLADATVATLTGARVAPTPPPSRGAGSGWTGTVT